MTELSKDLQERMVRLAEVVAASPYHSHRNEARSILRELPDPDLEAAERMATEAMTGTCIPAKPEDCESVRRSIHNIARKAALLGIRHGKGTTA